MDLVDMASHVIFFRSPLQRQVKSVQGITTYIIALIMAALAKVLSLMVDALQMSAEFRTSRWLNALVT